MTSSEKTVQQYLGICLLSQAGVALGLSVIIENQFSVIGGEAAVFGTIILSVVAISTMFLEMAGPIAAKWGLAKAGEVGNGSRNSSGPTIMDSVEQLEPIPETRTDLDS